MIEETELPSGPESPQGDSVYATAVEQTVTLEELEKRYMRYILEKTGGKKEKAAQILGISRRTLYRKEREFGWVTGDESEEGQED